MKKFLAVLAAACLVFGTVGCQQNDVSTGQEQTSAVSNDTIIPKVKEEETESETKSETASETESETAIAPQDDEINIETFAAGEEHDYNIEDILKNDLEIDGIPISIPCTLNELLETLGDDYSVDKSAIKDSISRDKVTKSKYFTGEFVTVYLDYSNGEEEYICGHLMTICDPKKVDFDTVNIIGYSELSGKLSLSGFSAGDSIDKYIEKYGKPNRINVGDKSTGLIYKDNDCRIAVIVENQNSTIIDSFMMTFETETDDL